MSAGMAFHKISGLNMSDYILMLSETMLTRINSQYMAAATLSLDDVAQPIITVWFNNQPHHTAPLTLNLAHNALIRAIIGNDVSINVTNQPYIFTPDSRIEMLQAGNNMGFQLAGNTGFAMAFVSAFYVLFYIKV